MKEFIKGWVLAVALGVILVPVGCGKGSVDSTLPPGASAPLVGVCPAGQISIAGGPCAANGNPQQFFSQCQYGYGQYVTISGIQVCKANVLSATWFQSLPGPTNNYPRLNAVGDFNAMKTGQTVLKGDLLTISQGTGGWGNGVSSMFDSSCKNGPVSLSDSAQGLFGSDGVERFFIGASVSHVIGNNGVLSLGFNPGGNMNCAIFSFRIQLQRCQDVNGTTYTCQ